MREKVPGFDGYEADHLGNIWSVSTNWRGYGDRVLMQILNIHGYAIVRVYRNGKRINQPVHKLICLAFNGQKPSPIHEVRHLDGSRTNNFPSNLLWGTKSENAQDRTKHGIDRGIFGNNQKLTKKQAIMIKRIYRHGMGVTLAKYYGVTPTTIRNIAKGETWKST